ncbi:MAG: acetate--CoA ligase family protein [Actinobacteria bacterium]|nr:acetate--CoA ligase family protein [Actinomycetota bacterium]
MEFTDFFCPKSVAVIGASRDKTKVGHTIVDNILNSGYKGKVLLVNPNTDEILGHKCYKSVLDIEDSIDLAIMVIPNKYIMQALEDCSKKQTKFSIIISAGFKETGKEGALLEKEIAEKAKQYGIRLLGPNCLGMIDFNCPLNASFSPNMPESGVIAFLSQSGALGTAVLDWAKTNNIGLSKFVSMGNKADIGEIDLFMDWLDDKETNVITAYIEGVTNGKEFMKVCSKVTKHKPIIVIKSGNTDAGAKAVSSHTGTLSGSSKAYEAAFKQTGIIRAKTVKDLFNLATAFAHQPLPEGRNIAIVTNAGGPGIMASDACEENGINLAKIKPETVEELKTFLPPAGNFYNPIDVLGDALAQRYEKTFEVILKDKDIHAMIVLLTPQAMTDELGTAKALAEALEKSGRKIPVVTSFMGGHEVKEGVDYLNSIGIPNFSIPEEAVQALKALIDQSDWIKKDHELIKAFNSDKKTVSAIFKLNIERNRLELGEMEARDILTAYNIRVPYAGVAKNITDAHDIIKNTGYPVVLKIDSPDILHKSDVGGIKVGIKNDEELESAFHTILANVKKSLPQARINGISIQEMVQDKKEVIIGVNKDPQFGHMIMFGLGGIYVEILKDVSFRIAPIKETDSKEMIDEIKTVKLLKGARGEKPSDIDSIVEVLLKISQLVTDFPEIVEMDINPLFVKEKGKGAIAGDVRIRIEK